MKETEDIWYEYHQKMTAFIRNKVAEDAVDDILQDVFVKIHSRINTLKEGAKLESWVYQITRNSIIDYYRSNRKTEELPDWIEQAQPEKGETIRQELSSCLEPMIKELPDKYREAIQLSEIENKTQKEVAEIANISLSGAKSRIQRGRLLLKGLLHECCDIEVGKYKQIVDYTKKPSAKSVC
ncbi:MAG: RNA polymerase sigma factor SigZ [bacterium]